MMKFEAHILDQEGEDIDVYYWSDECDAEYALNSTIEEALEDDIDYYEIIVVPLCPTEDDLKDPLARWCPSTDTFEVKEEGE